MVGLTEAWLLLSIGNISELTVFSLQELFLVATSFSMVRYNNSVQGVQMLSRRAVLGLLPLILLCLTASVSFGQASKSQAVSFTPLTLSLAADKSVVTFCSGDKEPATVQIIAKGSATVGNSVRYSWRATGGTIEGEGQTVTWNLTGLEPGSYKAFLEIHNDNTNEECQAFSSTTVLIRCIPPICPNVSIVCPDRVVADEPITFSANLVGGSSNVSATYNWTVSAGRIIEGQGTPSIKVDTKGLGGQTVKATFSVVGYGRDCSAVCMVQIPLPQRMCRKFDEFGNIKRNDEKARLDNYAVELQNDPTSTAYVIVYPGTPGLSAETRSSRIVDYLVNTRGLDRQRIVTVIGSPRKQLMVELWLCPQGVTPPAAEN